METDESIVVKDRRVKNMSFIQSDQSKVKGVRRVKILSRRKVKRKKLTSMEDISSLLVKQEKNEKSRAVPSMMKKKAFKRPMLKRSKIPFDTSSSPSFFQTVKLERSQREVRHQRSKSVLSPPNYKRPVLKRQLSIRSMALRSHRRFINANRSGTECSCKLEHEDGTGLIKEVVCEDGDIRNVILRYLISSLEKNHTDFSKFIEKNEYPFDLMEEFTDKISFSSMVDIVKQEIDNDPNEDEIEVTKVKNKIDDIMKEAILRKNQIKKVLKKVEKKERKKDTEKKEVKIEKKNEEKTKEKDEVKKQVQLIIQTIKKKCEEGKIETEEEKSKDEIKKQIQQIISNIEKKIMEKSKKKDEVKKQIKLIVNSIEKKIMEKEKKKDEKTEQKKEVNNEKDKENTTTTTFCSDIGGRPSNEDSFSIIGNAQRYFGMEQSNLRVDVIEVNDGHAGKGCSKYCNNFLLYHIFGNLKENEFENIEKLESALKVAIKKGFEETDFKFCKLSEKYSCSSGCTSTIAFILSNKNNEGEIKIVVGSVGDSMAIIHVNNENILISKRHKPSDKEEKEMIEKLGGRVTFFYGKAQVNGYLNVSRAFGNAKMKKYVCSDPYIGSCSIRESDVRKNNLKKENFLMVFSDGVIEKSQNVPKDVVDFVKQNSSIAANISKDLVEYARKQGARDNATCVVHYF